MEYMSNIYNEYQFDKSLKETQRFRRDVSNFVPGSGSHVPRAIFVGMCPDAVEKKNKRVLSGKAGEEFEIILDKSGIFRSDIYITYIVKYFMTGIPYQALIEEAAPYLTREINLLKEGGCRTVVAMGTTAYHNLIDIVDSDDLEFFCVEDPRIALSPFANKVATKRFKQELGIIGQRINDLVE